MNVSVLGAGAWGTAVAAHLAARHDVVLWARDPALVAGMAEARENRVYLAGCALPPALRLDADLGRAVAHARDPASLAVLATPVAGLRPLLTTLRASAQVPAHFVWLCKGFEAETGLLPHQVVADVLGGDVSCGAVTGPSFAREVAQGLPVALTAASQTAPCRLRAQQAFHHAAMRIYTSDDIVGVEVGGAVKNVLAIATGIADGMGLGLNARAALVTRGLAEMTRLGVALGAHGDTFTGLSGVGDLILTATGDLSRNRTVGIRLASGQPLARILDELGHVAEGVRCAGAVRDLALRERVDMPLTEAVCRILFEDAAPREVLASLLRRDAKTEGGEHQAPPA
ncbi:MAG: NAD(P)H-dependent glycerol-3-phosphate dehydrogenase [Janthinobacterium lividum]